MARTDFPQEWQDWVAQNGESIKANILGVTGFSKDGKKQ